MKMTMTGRLGIAAALCGIFLMTACAKKSGSPAGGGTGSGTFSVDLNGKTVSGTSSINNAIVVIPADPQAAFDTMGDIFVSMQVPVAIRSASIFPTGTGVTAGRRWQLCDHLRGVYHPKRYRLSFRLGSRERHHC